AAACTSSCLREPPWLLSARLGSPSLPPSPPPPPRCTAGAGENRRRRLCGHQTRAWRTTKDDAQLRRMRTKWGRSKKSFNLRGKQRRVNAVSTLTTIRAPAVKICSCDCIIAPYEQVLQGQLFDYGRHSFFSFKTFILFNNLIRFIIYTRKRKKLNQFNINVAFATYQIISIKTDYTRTQKNSFSKKIVFSSESRDDSQTIPLTWFLCSLPPFLFSPALPLIVIGERARKREIDEERDKLRGREKRGETPFLRWGLGYPAATASPGSIPTIPTKVQATLSLCLRARSVCLPNLPSRALESPEKISTIAGSFRLALLRSGQYISVRIAHSRFRSNKSIRSVLLNWFRTKHFPPIADTTWHRR
ncbi:hypothetical protein ALC60_03601, partial [Trachymyrmex zeteki]